jgi:VIT1/CCC1 family predicted Fe2+/Mn2+ transporter
MASSNPSIGSSTTSKTTTTTPISTEKTPLTTALRNAYTSGDVEASRNHHDTKLAMLQNGSMNHGSDGNNTEEGHQTAGQSLKPIIFGGLDGILTSFAIVAGSAGGKLSPSVVLILGFSNIFADALSMGVGEFLSSKAENEWILSERDREEWELENYPAGEVQEMVDLYVKEGMDYDDAVLCITTMSKYKDFFVNHMMNMELQLQVPSSDHVQESMQEGFVMFCSFAFFGALPLLGYVLIPAIFPHANEVTLFTSACTITGIVLFLMGSVKSYFSKQHWYRAGLETLLLGGTCATVAYVIGQLVERIVTSSTGTTIVPNEL